MIGHSVSVAAAVDDGRGRVLAIRRRDTRRWQPPGGILELDETITHGLAREIREEAGVAIADPALTGVYHHLPLGVVALFFRCHHASGSPRPTDEAVDVAWLARREVAGVIEPMFAVRIFDALDYDGGPIAVRSHDGSRLLVSRADPPTYGSGATLIGGPS